jgi:hypothetical protein
VEKNVENDLILNNRTICAHEAHEIFAQAYAVHGNALAAYKVAYPEASPRTAQSHAYEIAAHPDVQRRVVELQAARRAHLLAQMEDLEAVVANLCEGKATKLIDPDTGKFLPLHELPLDVQAAIKGLKVKVTTTRNGDTVREYTVDFPDPVQALRLLAQLRGALIERSDITSGGRPLPAPVAPEQLPELDRELRQRLLPAPIEDDDDDYSHLV